MASSGARFTLGTVSATSLLTPDLAGGMVVIKNQDATNSANLGGSTVTTTTGFELKAGQQVGPFMITGNAVLYAIAAAGTPRVDVLTVDA